MFEMQYTIPPELVDNDYKHVHHADSLKILEQARLKYLEAIGFPNEKLIAEGMFLVVSSCSVRYKRELFAEKVRITCENPAIERRSMSLDQIIYKESGKPAVLASVHFMCMDGASKRGVVPPQEFLRAFMS